MTAHHRAFHLLSDLYADPAMAEVFGEERTIAAWLEVEAALAEAQGDVGVLPQETARVLAAAVRRVAIDRERLWNETRVVGYPILPLIRQAGAQLPAAVAGRLHFGATTQDIMDTGWALQVRDALARLDDLLVGWGDALADAALRHAGTVMAGRTHNQQAVPTTFGAKLATLLDEVRRHRQRLAELRPRACRVSLFGAGGTAAALGPRSADVRARLAARLGLEGADVPWHAARDAVAEFVSVAALTAQTAARFAREVANLSRTEIGEVFEPAGHHRGASSTMPQKANPITAEVILGLASIVRGYVGAGLGAMLVEHERATGEWHVEWDAVPRTATLAAGALAAAGELTRGLRVDADAMRRNLAHDHGLIMAEAFMIRLAGPLGQAGAHDRVYAATADARHGGVPLAEALRARVDAADWRAAGLDDAVTPESYLGEATAVAQRAAHAWHAERRAHGGVPS